MDGPPITVEPGQFTMLYAFGVGEIPVSASGVEDRLIHTIRAVGAVSHALCALRRGDQVGARGPFGRPWPLRDAEGSNMLFVAGGIGLAPLRPAIVHFLRHLDRYGTGTLLCGSRTPGEILFRKEVDRWAQHPELLVDVDGVRAALTSYTTVDIAESGWRGMVGPVPKAIARARIDPASTVAFVCGPEVLITFAAETLMARGLPATSIYVSLERNMQCAIGHCGHCQLGPTLVCRDGPVYSFDEVATLIRVREL
jgi:NAD(P)H-flavin reductase